MSDMSNDKRKAIRRPFHQLAFVDFGDGSSPRPCTVDNISKTGARILLNTEISIPTEFSLALTGDGKVRRHCRVTRRSEREVGVAFVPMPKAFRLSTMSLIGSEAVDSVDVSTREDSASK